MSVTSIHPKNTFAVKKGASMKLQVLVKQLSNCRERPHESKNNWQLKELISGAAKNKSYHTTNCHALAVK